MSARKKPASKSREAGIIIPDKLYFRIGEVAKLSGLPPYVLRFWETEFPQLKPTKSGTGQRMYRRKDVECLLRIKGLLYKEGFTIAGARQLLREEGKRQTTQSALPFPGVPLPALSPLRKGLRDILGILSQKR